MILIILSINVLVEIDIDKYFVNIYGDQADMSQLLPINDNPDSDNNVYGILTLDQNSKFVYQFPINRGTVFPLKYYKNDTIVEKLILSISQQFMVNYTSQYQLQQVGDYLIQNCNQNGSAYNTDNQQTCRASINIVGTQNTKYYDLQYNQTNFYYKQLNASQIIIDFFQNTSTNSYNVNIQINFTDQNTIKRAFPNDTATIQIGQLQFINYQVLNSQMLQGKTDSVFHGTFRCSDLINNVRMCGQAIYSLYSTLKANNQARVRIFSNRYSSDIFTDYKNQSASIIVTGFIEKVVIKEQQNIAVGVVVLILSICSILCIIGLSIYCVVDYQNPKSKFNMMYDIGGWSNPDDMVATCHVAYMVASKLNPYLDTDSRLAKLSQNVIYKSSIRYQQMHATRYQSFTKQQRKSHQSVEFDTISRTPSTIDMLSSDVSKQNYKYSQLPLRASGLRVSQLIKAEEEEEEQQHLLTMEDLK